MTTSNNCACGLSWGHTGKHAPDSTLLRILESKKITHCEAVPHNEVIFGTGEKETQYYIAPTKENQFGDIRLVDFIMSVAFGFVLGWIFT